MNKILFSLVIVLLSACAARPVAMMTSSSPLSPGVRGTLKTQATSCQYHLFGLIPISSSLNSGKALESAKKQVNSKVLTDVTSDFTFGHYILFSNSCVRISGLGVVN